MQTPITYQHWEGIENELENVQDHYSGGIANCSF